MADLDAPTCPFCPFSDEDASFVTEHINFCHPERGATPAPRDSRPLENTHPIASPFPVDVAPTDQDVDCPHGCGETVTTAELSTHLDLHVAEDIALDESDTDATRFNPDLMPESHDFSLDCEASLDLSTSRKSGKRGADRDFARNNSSKPERARSPPRMIGPDGAKRLGVCFQLSISL